MAPIQGSTFTCACHAATSRLLVVGHVPSGEDNMNMDPPNDPKTSISSPYYCTPSEALLQARSLTIHWTQISSICPNSDHHLSSSDILRWMVSALRSITLKYEAHTQEMVFLAKVPDTTGTNNQNLLVEQDLYPHFGFWLGRCGSGSVSSSAAGGSMEGHIGLYRLEQDETQILLQEAFRASIEELGGLLAEIQRRVVSLREYDAAETGYHRGADQDGDQAERGEDQTLEVSRLPTDQEMAEINMRLYRCLRRLDLLEGAE